MRADKITAPGRNALVHWVLGGQLVLTVVLAGIAGVWVGVMAAVSLVVGGLIGFLANLAYVWRAMQPESDPGKALKGQLVAEIYKFVVAVTLFAVVFATFRNIVVVMVFVGFGTTFVIHWFAMLRRNQWMGETGRS
jgi:F0F1-type ATP synthase assembly protein I